MTTSDTGKVFLTMAAPPAITSRGAHLRANLIDEEPQWRWKPPASTSRLVATRWRSLEHRIREVSAETPSDMHVVAIVLHSENVLFSVSGRTVHDGIVAPGTFHVTEPASPTRCVFRGPYDVLHLHVPHASLGEIRQTFSDGEPALMSRTVLQRDQMIERLGRALLASERIGGSYGHLYAESVSIAIVARLLGLYQTDAPQQRKVAELAKWRLKRALEYIEASLAESVSLTDIASAAGLTRMHFAAQFKAATGLRPHEYLLRRRIERAQEKLAGTSMSLVEVALSVGFQTQSHFTSVFTRMVGQPPRAWREAQDKTSSCFFGTCRAPPEAFRPSFAYPGRVSQAC